MTKYVLALSLLSILGLSVACNKNDQGKTPDSSSPQMEQDNQNRHNQDSDQPAGAASGQGGANSESSAPATNE